MNGNGVSHLKRHHAIVAGVLLILSRWPTNRKAKKCPAVANVDELKAMITEGRKLGHNDINGNSERYGVAAVLVYIGDSALEVVVEKRAKALCLAEEDRIANLIRV